MVTYIARRTVLIGAVSLLFAPSLQAAEPSVFQYNGVGASGYDVVAYFTDGKPVDGSDAFTASHDGATWRFSSAEHRDLFMSDPGKYAPQYGGYCAYAVSKGYTASTVPEAWKIVGGKLYLNYSLGVRKIWEKDIPGRIASANANWPGVIE